MQRVLFLALALVPLFGLANWSKQPEDNLKVEVGVVTPNLSFEIMAPEGLSQSLIKYSPNTQSKTSLGLSYRNIGISASSANSTSEESQLNYGNSRSTDLQFRFFGKRTYELFYQTYQGYYIENSQEIDSSYGSTSLKIQRPDIVSKNYGFNFYWNLNENDFSQAIAYDQMGIQTKSAWGLSWLIHGSQSSIEGQSELVPASVAPVFLFFFGQMASIAHFHRNTLATGLGIGGIASLNNFYIATMFALGFGYQEITYESLTSPPGTESITGRYISGRFGLGHNGPKNVLVLSC